MLLSSQHISSSMYKFICNLNTQSLLYAQHFVNLFRASKAYYLLSNGNFNDMSDKEVICFTLTRKPEDSKKIHPAKLQTVINNLSASLYLDDEKVISHLRLTLLTILSAVNYSKLIENEFIDSRLDTPCEGCYINLSGLNLCYINLSFQNLSNADFQLSNLSHANLTQTNLTSACLARTKLYCANLSGTKLAGTNIKNTLFKSLRSNYLIEFLTPFFNVQSLNQQLNSLVDQFIKQQENPILYELLAENICHNIDNMQLTFKEKLFLIENAINHPIFGDQKAHTLMNWINSGINLFPIKHKGVPYFPVSKSQARLIEFYHQLKNKMCDLQFIEEIKKVFNTYTNTEAQRIVEVANPVADFINKNGSCYSILDVPQCANVDDIKKKYKELVRKYHPDKNKEPNASNQFHLVQRAKEILLDLSLRKQHDDFLAYSNYKMSP